MTVAVFPVIYAKGHGGDGDMLRWSQRAIDLADGDPSKGDFIFGSPLALNMTRAIARYCLGGTDGEMTCARRGQRAAAPTRCPRSSLCLLREYLGVLAAHDPAVRESRMR